LHPKGDGRGGGHHKERGGLGSDFSWPKTGEIRPDIDINMM